MNPTTSLLLQLIAPAYLTLGVGMFLNKAFYLKLIGKLKDSDLIIIWGSAANLVVGPAILINHNLWGTGPEILVSLFGVIATLKGLHMALAPTSWFKMADKMINKTFINYAAPAVILIGLYMMWQGYLA